MSRAWGRRAGLAAAWVGAVVCAASTVGCVFGPVALEGRRCAASTDCITGYECSAALVCVLSPDAGRPDAGRPDAFFPDVGRDAPLALDASDLDANVDAPALLDAPLDDASDDASTPDDAPVPLDAASSEDVGHVDDAGADAAATGDSGPGDAGLDAAT